MAFEKLKLQLSSTIHFLRGLLLTILALLSFALWRLFILLLTCIFAPLRATWTPNLTLHMSSHALFQKQWQAFFKLSMLVPIVKHRVRIICCMLLAIQTVLAITILVKSCIIFLPWLIQGGHTHGELKVSMVFFLGTCVPVSWMGGVAVAALYYTKKVWKYGRFEKKMRRRPGGRGYWMDPGDVKGKGAEVKGTTGGAAVGEGGDNEGGVRWTGSTLVDGNQNTSPRSGQQSKRDVNVQHSEAAKKWRGTTSPPNVLPSIRNVRDKFQTGYDGRENRRAAWQAEEIEMNDITKR